jgi:predicted neuraminidase
MQLDRRHFARLGLVGLLGAGASLSIGGEVGVQAAASGAELQKEPIFPADLKHNHASCVIETPAGDLFAAWYAGSGERTADDVVIQGAWLRKGETAWRPRFLLADTPGYPDCNPALFAAPNGAIWLFWPTILDHHWEGALLKFAVSETPVVADGPPRWAREGVLHVTPTGFAEAMAKALAGFSADDRARYSDDLKLAEERAKQELYQRLGWMPRVHAISLPSGRWILPLYTDTFSASIMAISDDQGRTWFASQPLIGFGNIQPSLVRKADGTLVAYMRENGIQRHIRMSESKDDGVSWSPVTNAEFPNPGAGVDVVGLANGHWALIYNDTTKGRHSLAVSLSDDEGKSWKWTRHLEADKPGTGSFHYPSIIQGNDGALHATYTWSRPRQGSTIYHARFTEDWIRQGDQP